MKRAKSAIFAHSKKDRPKIEWELLETHLGEVATLAARFAEPFGCAKLAKQAGLLHDLGKASEGYQRYIGGAGPSVDHSSAGAIEAAARWPGKPGKAIAFVVAGHHAGLADHSPGGASGGPSALENRLAATGLSPIDPERKTPLLAGLEATLEAPKARGTGWRRGFSAAFAIRMIYSALVDADFLATEGFMKDGAVERADWDDLATLEVRLSRTLAQFAEKPAPSAVDLERRRLLDALLAGADRPRGLFTLEAPTGSGKTLASLAFALRHARAHGLRRVIYVIPYSSIIEQTAAVFRDALGERAVLEHHSAFDFDPPREREGNAVEELPSGEERYRLAAENWDAPIVVTTAVQFFESLFANRSSRCRKLHNIAGAVVILDEAQTLPLRLLHGCVAALDELAARYGVSAVLCTATQPALSSERLSVRLDAATELAPVGLVRAPAFARTRVSKRAGKTEDAEIVARLRAREQMLVIVNSRKHAQALFEGVRELDGARHLTTLMYAKHRQRSLEEIRGRLDRGEPVRLIATSLIEAGVDIDFPEVWRALAGIDQIAQAAGRCNREGRLDRGEVVVFEPAEHRAPPDLERASATAASIFRHFAEAPLGPEAVARYFENLYGEGESCGRLDEARIEQNGAKVPLKAALEGVSLELRIPFHSIARGFRMIESPLVPVIIAGAREPEASKLVEALRHAERIGGVARKLQPYLVQIPPAARKRLIAEDAAAVVAPDRFADQFVVLRNESLYDPEIGLRFDDPAMIEAGELIF